MSYILSVLHTKEIFFRLENDETGFYLSIIDRQKYPRIWADNVENGDIELIAESTESLLSRVTIGEKDWTDRLFGSTIEQLTEEVNNWYVTNHVNKIGE